MSQDFGNLIDDEAKDDLQDSEETCNYKTGDQIHLEDFIDDEASEEEDTDEFASFINDEENVDDATTNNSSDSEASKNILIVYSHVFNNPYSRGFFPHVCFSY